MAGNRSFVRDAAGRFAKSVGAAATAEAKRFAKEAAADAKRVARARLDAAKDAAQAEVDRAKQDVAALDARKPTRKDDPHEVVEWETDRKAARDRQRKAQLKLSGLRVARDVAN